MTSFGGEIPVIDISSFSDGSPADRDDMVRSVARACEVIGFFILQGHGVSERLVARMEAVSRAFFDRPAAEKCRIGETGDIRGGLMYFSLEAESLAATLGEAALADLKESLDFGPGFRGDAWPSDPPGLESAFCEYHAALSDLSARLRRIFMLAVGLPEDFLDSKFTHHLSSLRVLNYPDLITAPLAGQLRAGAHTDYGFLTVLHSKAIAGRIGGGLQVRSRTGAWHEVPLLAESFVVNIGDAMMRWTNGRWVSTLHRVVNPPSGAAGPSRRQSIAFFNNPSADAVIECLPPFCSPEAPAKYPPVTYSAYAGERYRQAHGNQKSLDLDLDWRATR